MDIKLNNGNSNLFSCDHAIVPEHFAEVMSSQLQRVLYGLQRGDSSICPKGTA